MSKFKPASAAFLILTTLGCGVLGVAVEPTATPVPTPTFTDTPTPTDPPTLTPLPTDIPTEVPVEPKELVICIAQEPDSLYIHSSRASSALHVQAALYDSAAVPYAVDDRSFGYQATITEKLPSLEDGDAVINVVKVGKGQRVVNADGEPVTLIKGAMVRPAGCRSSQCAVKYAGGEIEMDQMEVTFTLRDGLTWADGEPVKASDSVYSFELYMDPDSPTPYTYLGERTASYEAPDDDTLVWTGLPGYMDSTYSVNIWIPLPEHAWGHMSASKLARAEESRRTPMGYGPFTTVEWELHSHITLKKNEYYFRADEGLPKIDTIEFRFVGEDPSIAVVALLAGECDIVTQDTYVSDLVEMLIEKEDAGDLQVPVAIGMVWEHVDFGIDPVEGYGRPDFFEDKRVRQAIAMCLDRQAVVNELLYGRSEVMHTYLPSNHPLYNGSARQYPYDPEAGMALLEDAGWIDTNGDGIRECRGCDVEGAKNGTPLAFKWSSTTATLRKDIMQLGQANLRECGIDVTLEHLPSDEWFADGPAGPLFGRHFDLGEYSWFTSTKPPCDLYLSSEIPRDEDFWEGTNAPGYSNPEYDQVCNDALQALPGTPEYTDNHLKAQEIFAEDLPTVPLFPLLKVAAARPEVVGFDLDSTVSTEMWNVEYLDLAEDE